jgi:transposase
MMGRQDRDQRQLFYEFSLDELIPADHLLRRINLFATAVLADLHEQLKAFYSDIGRPSVDPELMIRMLLVGYCYGIRHERRLRFYGSTDPTLRPEKRALSPSKYHQGIPLMTGTMSVWA